MRKCALIFLSVNIFQKICISQPLTRHADSITVAASVKYNHPSLFERILIGSNYRKEWRKHVKMPVFEVEKNEQQFTIDKLGGGMETKSLHLNDSDERDWALRSVDKDVSKTLPGIIRKTFIKRMVQSVISASYPYAGLSVPLLSTASGVVAGSQQLYFVPDDSALGQFRPVMANKVCILVNRQPVSEVDLETDEMMNKLKQSNHYLVDQKDLLKARLIDWLVADWDRHPDQFRWVPDTSSGKTLFFPLPRDRDQAFFYSNGILIKFIALFGLPYLKGFKKRSTGIKQLSRKSHKMDQALLNELDRNEWESIIKDFQKNVADEVIEAAIKKQPREIYAISGDNIIDKLKSRRNGLLKNAMKYYSYLARKVTISGSDQPELFRIKNYGDSINISIYDYSGQTASPKIYDRSFNPGDTKVIYIKGLDGDDQFKMEGHEANNIKLVFDGGGGKNKYNFTKGRKVRIK